MEHARVAGENVFIATALARQHIRGGNKVRFLFALFCLPTAAKKSGTVAAARGKYSNILRQSAQPTHISVTYAAAWQRPSIINIGKIETHTHTEGGSTLRPLCII
jgi:hypothetical protein